MMKKYLFDHLLSSICKSLILKYLLIFFKGIYCAKYYDSRGGGMVAGGKIKMKL